MRFDGRQAALDKKDNGEFIDDGICITMGGKGKKI